MKNRLIKTFLILVILSPLIHSLSFAQEELANEIIEEKIDELWTTGKLNIGNANIASKHWLPALYERNGFQLLWQNPQNVKDLINDLGSIAEDGLNPEDYHLLSCLFLNCVWMEINLPIAHYWLTMIFS